MKKHHKIRSIREKLHLTQKEWAKALKVAQVTISSWEVGVRSPSVPHASLIVAYCNKRGMKVTFDDILAG